jgi:DNA-binding transcriptional LysR family regulator
VTQALDALADGERATEGLAADPEGRLDLTDRRIDLVDEGIDLALRQGPLDDSSLVARRLGAPQRPLTYASPDQLKRRRVPRHPRRQPGRSRRSIQALATLRRKVWGVLSAAVPCLKPSPISVRTTTPHPF